MNRCIAAAIALALLVEAIALASPLQPILPDVYARITAANSIVETGFPQLFGNSIAPQGAQHTYPPAADLALSSLSLISGLAPEMLWRLLAFLSFAIFMFSLLKFSEPYITRNQQALMLALVSLTPIILRRYSGFVSEALALPFMLLALHSLQKRRPALAGIFLGFIALLHLRTFLTTLLVIGLWALLNFIARKQQPHNAAAAAALALAIASVWYAPNLPAVLSLNSFQNPWLLQSAALIVPSLGIPLLAISIPSLLFLRKKLDTMLLSLIALPLAFLATALLPSSVPFPHRELIFLVPALALFSAIAISRLINSRSILAASFGALLLAAPAFFAVLPPPSEYSMQDISAFEFISWNFQERTAFASDYVSSYALAYFGHSSALGSFMERLPDASERAALSYGFFHSEKNSFMERYGLECIFSKSEYSIQQEHTAQKNLLYASDSRTIYC